MSAFEIEPYILHEYNPNNINFDATGMTDTIQDQKQSRENNKQESYKSYEVSRQFESKQSPLIGYVLFFILIILGMIITYWLSILKKVFDDSDEYEFDRSFQRVNGRVSPYEVSIDNDDFI